MNDVEMCAQMMLIKELMAFVFTNAYRKQPEAFENVMSVISDRFRYKLQAPAHATADDAAWLQSLQTQALKDTDAFRDLILTTIRQRAGS